MRLVVHAKVENDVLQETRLRNEVAGLEKDTGVKLRLLAQNYPETPGRDLMDCCSIALSR